jgi:hypothetical protein
MSGSGSGKEFSLPVLIHHVIVVPADLLHLLGREEFPEPDIPERTEMSGLNRGEFCESCFSGHTFYCIFSRESLFARGKTERPCNRVQNGGHGYLQRTGKSMEKIRRGLLSLGASEIQ